MYIFLKNNVFLHKKHQTVQRNQYIIYTLKLYSNKEIKDLKIKKGKPESVQHLGHRFVHIIMANQIIVG